MIVIKTETKMKTKKTCPHDKIGLADGHMNTNRWTADDP